MASGGAPLRLHTRCDVGTYGRGEILFVGQTSFSPGVWVGIALDEPNGKHDGVVQGKRYFTANGGHGLFVRTSQVNVLDEEEEEEEQAEAEEEEVVKPRSVATSASSRPSTASPIKGRMSAIGRTPGTVNRPRTSAMPPPSAASAAAARRLSPTKGMATPASSRPASTTFGSAARPSISRAPSAASSAASGSSRPTTAATPRTSSSLARNAAATATPRTPAAASRARPTPASATAGSATTASRMPARTPGTATSIRSARAMVPGKAPDTATARAGLRPVAHSRPSMTPARSGAAAAAATPLPSRTPATATTRAVPSHSRASAQQTTRRVTNDDDDDEEDLLAMSIDDDDPSRLLPPSSSDSERDEEVDVLDSPSLRKRLLKERDHMSLSSGPGATASSSTGGTQAARAAAAAELQREVEELRAKLRIAEKKREEDREKMREMELVKNEADQFLAVKPKLTERQAELQNDLRDLRKLEKDWTTQREELERQLAEAQDQAEMALLDKEMAEEKAEAAMVDLEAEKEKAEELQIEVEVLREENALYEHGGSNEADKSSPGYLQLEKQNERLKDALIRLRDLTTESEGDQKRRIAELEKELNSLSDLQQSYESVCGRLETSDALLEDLKIQLDDALGAEEMLEQLTDKNLMLGERIEEMQVMIEDLEALKELNDELEETHVETEKQLQEEVDLKDMQLREHKARHESLQANVADYESTFAQFRELVLNLQTDLEQLRSEQAEAREAVGDGKDLASQSQAMLNLNMKLQSSNLKSQAKTIDLELGKLDASQALSNLDMIRPYLPPAFFEADADAVASLLFFRRMAHKADLIKTIVEGNHDIAGSLASVVPESLIGICQMRHSLAHFAASSRQIAAVVQYAPVETFLKAGRMYRELASIEKRIDGFIEGLRREEVKEDECGREFRRFVKSFEEFSFALGSSGCMTGEEDWDLAAKEIGSATLFDHDLDTLAAALGFAKQSVASLYNDEEIEWELGGKSVEDDVFEPLQTLIDNVRAAKVPARKLLRRLASLYANDEAVEMHAILSLPGLGQLSSQLVSFAAQLAQSLGAYTALVRTSKTPLSMAKVIEYITEASREGLGKVDVKLWSSPLQSTGRLSQTILELLAAATEQENVVKITGSSPWLLRVEQIKADIAHNVEAERQIAKLNEDAKDLYRQIKARDEALQEGAIKVERLQRQLEKSKEESLQMNDVKSSLSEMQRQAKAYQEGNEALQKELEEMQRTNDGLAQQLRSAPAQAGGEGTKGSAEMERGASAGGIGVTGNSFMGSSSLETSFLLDQVESLRGCLNHLRRENSYLKSGDLLKRMDALPLLQSRPTRVREQSEEPKKESGVPVSRKDEEAKSFASAVLETKVLYRQLLDSTSSPRVVLLPGVSLEKDASQPQPEQQKYRRRWQPSAKLPENQLLAQKQVRERIRSRVEALKERLPTMVAI
ncbi:hypothetical protein FA10DRAFT_266522 [Acaromyces ingoldii]|uniref:CAP-Gly domain-containing protein n=1 Tax=Acaromyces ingoldii TaxID=215250 RepID=A0A316YKC0_9BASI|nr:hypothetical protein FA10DRAFT_266522 [Acaromyces ingoldii]PWN90000.1 hypothetical protein FA10DRAFT_266522 [Acaromyces ingoldii]